VWSASVFGPADSPWEGGAFSLQLVFSERYPERPPRVRFTCEIFHPNVYPDGTICMDLIQDQWSPCHNTGTLLASIQVGPQLACAASTAASWSSTCRHRQRLNAVPFPNPLTSAEPPH